MATQKQIKSAFNVVLSATEVIREAREIPRGTLYAALMVHGCDKPTYDKMEAVILNTGLVERRGDLLRWVGPEISRGQEKTK